MLLFSTHCRHHIDYFGVAAVAHCLLFGQYMEVRKTKARWMPRGNFKRWWSADWKGFFEDFLNIDGVDRDCLPSLTDWRQKLLVTFETENMRPRLDRARQVLSRKTSGDRRRTL